MLAYGNASRKQVTLFINEKNKTLQILTELCLTHFCMETLYQYK